MADKEKEEQDESVEKAVNKLVERIINTPDKNLPEMTDIPLNMVEPIAGMIMIDDFVHMLTKRIEENIEIARSNGKSKKKRKDLVLLSESWQRAMFKLRRSVNADGLVRATDLAKEHMATRPYEEGKDSFDMGKPQ